MNGGERPRMPGAAAATSLPNLVMEMQRHRRSTTNTRCAKFKSENPSGGALFHLVRASLGDSKILTSRSPLQNLMTTRVGLFMGCRLHYGKRWSGDRLVLDAAARAEHTDGE
eukprot:78054-Pyramimonas_sp.AAC.1